MRLTRAGTVIMVSVCLTLLATGCAKRKPPAMEAETEPPKVVFTEKVTEKQTERHTEPPTEKQISPKDLQVSVPKSSRSGSAEYQIVTGSGEKTGTFDFASLGMEFMGLSGENGFYVSDKEAMTNGGEGWEKVEMSSFNLWDNFYKATYTETVQLDGTNCHKYVIETDDPIGQILGVAGLAGYKEIMNGDISFVYYVSTVTKDIVRVDGKATFMGDINDQTEQGEIMVVYAPTSKEAVTIQKPTAKEKETETVDDYEAGIISEEQNSYKNRTFNVQIIGNDLFYFDPVKTEELSGNYASSKSNYTEEAYGQADGVIVNITSMKKTAATASACMSKYLTDSKAENIQASTTLNIGNTTFVSSTSIINNTTTKTYCTEADERVLIITLYYQDESVVTAFESGLFEVDVDPFWTEEEWVLEGSYTVKTPQGYSIVNGKSSDLYVTMSSKKDELTVFAIENGNIDEEVSEESTTANNVTREVVVQESLPLSDGTTMTYLVVKNDDPSYTYYTYIGLLQKGTAVLKIYMVSTDGNADYRRVFTDMSNGISVNIESDDSIQVDGGEGNSETEVAQAPAQ